MNTLRLNAKRDEGAATTSTRTRATETAGQAIQISSDMMASIKAGYDQMLEENKRILADNLEIRKELRVAKVLQEELQNEVARLTLERPRRIVVIDDNEKGLKSMKRILTDNVGIPASRIQTSLTFDAAYFSDPENLVFLDVHLKNVDAVDRFNTLENVRAKVVMFSADESAAVRALMANTEFINRENIFESKVVARVVYRYRFQRNGH